MIFMNKLEPSRIFGIFICEKKNRENCNPKRNKIKIVELTRQSFVLFVCYIH